MSINPSVPDVGEAKLRYLDADFEVLRPGRFVVCSVTGRRIALEDLRYWSVELQEAFFDAETAFKRWKQVKAAP
ncbi:MAG: DUF2093 domain-containing protein [Alphaproteobacteria bacterium]|nr:DUF2093 domain-containing protein [Alphaproteobacteria bacterium]